MNASSSPHTGLSRRRLLRLGGAALAVGTAASVTACTRPSSDAITAQLVHGATGGSLKDTVDPHFPVAYPDIARVRQLYEPLLRYNADYTIEASLAESVEPNATATEWTVRLRPDVTFHNGRPVRASDVKASYERMLDPQKPAPFATDLVPIVDLAASRVVDDRTFRFHLKRPYAVFDQIVASYALGIVPEDLDLSHPVGTGPWKFQRFVPGQRSHFLRYDDYWDQRAAFDELVILDFADDAAKVNALLAGQVHTIDNLPTYLAGALDSQSASPLVSETGGWVPFTMRVDAKPFSDVRVRQAMRLIADRQEMINQALNGFGRVANDLYAPFDDDYLGNDLPQRQQDIDQARSLLRQAGQQDLEVELVTSTAVGAGGVESANLFVQHARKAGVRVRLQKVDSSIFYGEQYLQWVFAQDFWATKLYLPQATAASLKSSPYNETHWYDERYAGLIASAQQELDRTRRRTLLQDAQRMEYEQGGFLIWAFKNQVDAYSDSVTGLVPAREHPVSSFRFNLVKPVETR